MCELVHQRPSSLRTCSAWGLRGKGMKSQRVEGTGRWVGGPRAGRWAPGMLVWRSGPPGGTFINCQNFAFALARRRTRTENRSPMIPDRVTARFDPQPFRARFGDFDGQCGKFARRLADIVEWQQPQPSWPVRDAVTPGASSHIGTAAGDEPFQFRYPGFLHGAKLTCTAAAGTHA